MTQARWKEQILAESDRCITIEGNRYFPPNDVRGEYLRPSETRTVCPWKGTASYFDVVVDGEINRNAAWCYPETKPEADAIRGYIAFWRDVQVVD